MPMRAFSTLKRHLLTLSNTGSFQYKEQLKILYDFLRATPVFRTKLEWLEASYPEDDADGWIGTHITEARNKGYQRWPDDEGRRMRVFVRAIESMLLQGQDPKDWGFQMVFGSSFDDGTAYITRQIVQPLANYLSANLGDHSDVLYRLGRFKRLVENFDQTTLYTAYEANTGKGEGVYDDALRRFLFMEGIDYPYSKPRSGSGEADIIAGIESDDPLVLEVKLFNAKSYGPAYIAKGLGQAIRYAQNYSKTIGHLVVINLSDKRLNLPTDGPAGAPLRIVTEGVTVFITVVQGKPKVSASEEKKPQTVTVTRDQLVVAVDLDGNE